MVYIYISFINLTGSGEICEIYIYSMIYSTHFIYTLFYYYFIYFYFFIACLVLLDVLFVSLLLVC